ncbi:hypothetical protein DFP72DRAFT_898951 [Ephemerocybe angulata]|uniref:Uncharacterized protein n=1 Tax=Ephemerocybe angulata TaxID=980116 RepID=A0A8H6M641_9AGAR|nr:hypothetical protein DFP72DRAFT_898951 [Tulosesus angulatus]
MFDDYYNSGTHRRRDMDEYNDISPNFSHGGVPSDFESPLTALTQRGQGTSRNTCECLHGSIWTPPKAPEPDANLACIATAAAQVIDLELASDVVSPRPEGYDFNDRLVNSWQQELEYRAVPGPSTSEATLVITSNRGSSRTVLALEAGTSEPASSSEPFSTHKPTNWTPASFQEFVGAGFDEQPSAVTLSGVGTVPFRPTAHTYQSSRSSKPFSTRKPTNWTPASLQEFVGAGFDEQLSAVTLSGVGTVPFHPTVLTYQSSRSSTLSSAVRASILPIDPYLTAGGPTQVSADPQDSAEPKSPTVASALPSIANGFTAPPQLPPLPVQRATDKDNENRAPKARAAVGQGKFALHNYKRKETGKAVYAHVWAAIDGNKKLKTSDFNDAWNALSSEAQSVVTSSWCRGRAIVVLHC